MAPWGNSAVCARAEHNICFTVEQWAAIVHLINCPCRLGFHPGAKGHQGELEVEKKSRKGANTS